MIASHFIHEILTQIITLIEVQTIVLRKWMWIKSGWQELWAHTEVAPVDGADGEAWLAI